MLKWRWVLWLSAITTLFVVLCLAPHKSSGQPQLEPMFLGGLYWPSPDIIMFFGDPESQVGDDTSGYYRLQISTGDVQKVMDITDVHLYLFGNLSPDGSLIAYGYGVDPETPPEQIGLYVMNPDGTNVRGPLPAGANFAWLHDNKTIAYIGNRFIEHNGILLAEPREFLVFFDIESGQEIDAVKIEQRQHCDSELDLDKPREETMCAQRCDAGQPCVQYQDIPRPGGTAPFFFFPDGQHILFVDRDQRGFFNFFVFDLASLSSQQLSFFREGEPEPTEFELSPDGTAVAFAPPCLRVLNLQNGVLWELQEPLVPNEPESSHEFLTWSRDSQWIAFTRTTVFPPIKDEDRPWEVIVTQSPNQIWIVSRDGQQVRLVADLWVDSSGQIINLASNWSEEKRYYVGKAKVTKLAWELPSSLKAAWRKPNERRLAWTITFFGFALSLSIIVWFGMRFYRKNHCQKL
ncbi:MAG: hypothetical protein RMK89_06415 [Armatimonadota bacterium]|nr:hypothetical protein [Armatimonadota bacterium]MDW8143080.1 hypothetical protein [Armatimonadota bacterium]